MKRRLTGQEKDTKKSLETNVTNYIFALITMAKVRILLANSDTSSCHFEDVGTWSDWLDRKAIVFVSDIVIVLCFVLYYFLIR